MRIFTLKNKRGILLLDWIVLWHREDVPPTYKDFQDKYGDMYYTLFHKNEKIVELVEKV